MDGHFLPSRRRLLQAGSALALWALRFPARWPRRPASCATAT